MRCSMIKRFVDEKHDEDFTFVALLKDCSKKKDVFQGHKLHVDILKKGLLGKSPYLASSLISMYAKCGLLEKAREVLDEILIHNVVSWNALISGHAQQGQIYEALNCFGQMKREGISPNAITFICILKACGNVESIDIGEEIHEEIVARGLVEKHVALGTAIVDMYVKCRALARAKEALEQLPVRNTITWNALISGYAQHGQGHEALNCYERMRSEGLSSDIVTYICILKVCGKTKDLEKGTEIHNQILNRGFIGKDVMLGNALVDMYAKCGMLARAEEMLNELPSRNVVTWNALITGHAQQEQGLDALECFERMQIEGLSPDEITFICILKVCGQIRALDKGKQIHEKIMRRSLLEKDIMLGNSLVDMYAKCGELANAHLVLEKLHVRNIGSWSALITGYAQQEKGHEALNCYEQMEGEGLPPDAVTFIFILKACGIVGDIEKGKQIHENVLRKGLLGKNIALGTALVDMYAKCGALSKAHQVLEELPARNIIMWSSLITGYVRKGNGEEALNYFKCMKCEGLFPDAITFICILKSCGTMGNIDMGKKIHEEIVKRCMLDKHTELRTALVDMYSKCGELAIAQELLKEVSFRDVSDWNALIEGYAQYGKFQEAFNCLQQMEDEGLSPNAVTFICILQACGSMSAIDEGKRIHEMILQRGLSEKHIVLGTALVNMYAKCGVLNKAQEVLQEVIARDVVSWNTLISGYAQEGQYEEALNSLERMLCESISPDMVTLICILKACRSKEAIGKGKKIHVISFYFEMDTVLGNALVDMYAKCGVLAKAELVFKELPIQSILSWNALIAGYVQQGQGYEALNCFERMQSEGLYPDGVTFTCVLTACGNSLAIDKGKQIHGQVVSRSLLETDIVLADALVNMYVKCGVVSKAHEVLKQLRYRDVVSWNALIGGYAQQGLCHEAFKCLKQMQSDGLCPDAITFIFILKACGNSGAIEKGEQIHKEIVNQSLLKEDVLVGNALVDMYAKCGMLVKAQRVLEELLIRDVVSWNTLIARYAEHGKGDEALICFKRMQSEGISPDQVTFLCVLSACSHSGLLDEAEMLYGNMSKKYGVDPNIEHHTCMVLAFGCGGHFDKVMSVIRAMPSSDYPAIWLALLGVCKKWGNLKLGQLAFDQALQLDNCCAAAYILMVDIFALAGMQADVKKIESMQMKYVSSKKKQGNNVGGVEAK